MHSFIPARTCNDDDDDDDDNDDSSNAYTQNTTPGGTAPRPPSPL
jgi:hypothetical protein